MLRGSIVLVLTRLILGVVDRIIFVVRNIVLPVLVLIDLLGLVCIRDSLWRRRGGVCLVVFSKAGVKKRGYGPISSA